MCLLDPVHWDRFLLDISFLFVESLILDVDDSIDFIHLLFDEGDSSLLVVRELAGPLLPSLHTHSSQICTSLDTFAQHFEEMYLPFEVKNVSFDYVLQQFLKDYSHFKIYTETMEHLSEASYILRFLPTYSFQDWGDFIHTSSVMFLPKGKNVVRRSWTTFCTQFQASTIHYTPWMHLSSLPFHFLGDFLGVKEIVVW